MANQVRASQPRPGVGQVLLNAPPRNILDSEAWQDFEAALRELRDGGVRVVVIGSAVDDFFMAHGSLQRIIDVFTGGSAGDVDAQRRVMRELDSGSMVSVAAVDGQAWGGGAELCWACDLRVASEGASFAQPEVNIGLTPGWGGISKVAHLAGEGAALRLALDGRPIPAEEAFLMGLVHRVVPRGDSLAAATEWATWLVGRPPWALAANKALVKEIRALPLREALRKEIGAFAVCASRPDSLELIRGAQERYDAGGDSHDAFGVPRS